MHRDRWTGTTRRSHPEQSPEGCRACRAQKSWGHQVWQLLLLDTHLFLLGMTPICSLSP